MRSQSIQEQDAKFREALRAVPIHNPRATVKVSPDYPDEVEITVPLVYKNPVARFLRDLLKASDVKQYKLGSSSPEKLFKYHFEISVYEIEFFFKTYSS